MGGCCGRQGHQRPGADRRVGVNRDGAYRVFLMTPVAVPLCPLSAAVYLFGAGLVGWLDSSDGGGRAASPGPALGGLERAPGRETPRKEPKGVGSLILEQALKGSLWVDGRRSAGLVTPTALAPEKRYQESFPVACPFPASVLLVHCPLLTCPVIISSPGQGRGTSG